MSSLDVRAIDAKELRAVAAPAAKQAFRVFLSEAAFDRAVARGDTDTTREIGGVLIGELLRDDAGPYLRIDGTIDALHAEEKGAELTFTHATWEHIHKEMDAKHQDKRVVGWYHTHPGFGIFLSDRDQFIHKSFFNLPFQVAFVYDPKSREHGMFTWHDNEISRVRCYWIGAREQTWDGPRAPVEGAGMKGGDKAADRARGAAKLDEH
ncbi:MAG: Mov34/MPN/PAD-1 family protein, partial [Myxococcales bacterium]|nr:Mov34/MPN/PAD-1 family protein [Myxococcales bacterium]